jgi:hypothetical protein
MCARLSAAALAVAFASLSGCGPAKLNQTKTLSVDVGEARAIDLDGQPKPQKVNVKYSSPEEVSVLVFKEVDARGDDMLDAGEGKALGKSKGKDGTFSVDVPENTPVRVVVRGSPKKTDVKLEITN